MDLPPAIYKCINEAEKSEYRYKLGAAVVRQKKIIGRGYNAIRNHKLNRYYDWDATLHAEAAAILSAPKDKIKNSTLYVVRVNNNGRLLLAKPCVHCMGIIRDYNIKRVVYSVDGGLCELSV